MQYISVVIMHVEKHGEGKNLLMLIPPFPLYSAYFNKMLDFNPMPPNWRILIPDLPGFGKSKNIDGDIVTMDKLAELIKKLLTNLTYEKLIIGGVSMGGYITMAFEKLYPDISDGLILSNTSDLPDADNGKNRNIIAEKVMREGKANFLNNLLKRLLGDTSFNKRIEIVEYTKELISETSELSIAQMMRGMGKREDSRIYLSDINKPILVICGNEDAITGEDLAIQMHSKYKNSEINIISNTGHYSAIEDPKQYALIIRSFLSKL